MRTQLQFQHPRILPRQIDGVVHAADSVARLVERLVAVMVQVPDGNIEANDGASTLVGVPVTGRK